MEMEEMATGQAVEELERWTMPRCAVDEEAMLLVVQYGCWAACRIVELSLDGCRMSAGMRLPAGIPVRVEASFKVRGTSFRFSGVAEWIDGQSFVGVRFVDVPLRRREELAAALCKVEAEDAARSERQTAGKLAAEKRATPEQAGKERAGLEPARPPRAKDAKPDRRAHFRHKMNTQAVVHLINVGSRLRGRILDLSLGGCRIRTDERFPVGIYTRVETEFRLEGLPFRLGGVIQAIHGRNQAGIRFLDMSERKRAQIEQLIEEIEESHAGRNLAKPEDSA
jgi:c-di-GMP-binding flagellar brake protein YcgR